MTHLEFKIAMYAFVIGVLAASVSLFTIFGDSEIFFVSVLVLICQLVIGSIYENWKWVG